MQSASTSIAEVCGPPPNLPVTRRLEHLARASLVLWLCLAYLACGKRKPTGPDSTPPAAVGVFSATVLGSDTVRLTWTAPGDDGQSGKAAAYDARRSRSPITAQNFDQADTLGSLPSPAVAGSPEQLYSTNLPGNSSQYFAVRASDERGNWSPINSVGPVRTAADTIPPAAATDLRILSTTDTSLTLTWTAPGDDGNRGRVSNYEVRYLGGGLNSGTWERAHTPKVSAIASGLPRSQQRATVSQITPRVSIQVSLRAIDESGNLSQLSNSVSSVLKGTRQAWLVRTGQAGDLQTVQAAIDSSLDGDSLWVGPGTYFERIDFKGKQIAVRSLEGRDATILDASRSGPGPVVLAINGETDATLLEGFTITGGTGYAAHIETERDGGGLYASQSYPSIRSNRIVRNSCTYSGGGVYLRAGSVDGSRIQFTDNIIEDNTAGLNSGGAVIDACDVVVIGNSFLRNSCQYDGGGAGIGATCGVARIERNVFIENHAGDHAGGLMVGGGRPGSSFLLTHNVFYGNQALGLDSDDTGAGGAVMVIATDGHISRNSFVANFGRGLSGCPGGAILFEDVSSLVRVDDNIFALNEDCTFGCRSNVTVSFARNLFWQNVGDSTLAEPHACPKSWFDGAIVGDPLFCDPEALDFRVAANSPARFGEEVIGGVDQSGCDGSPVVFVDGKSKIRPRAIR